MQVLNRDDLVIGGYYRHKKSGGIYQIVMLATIHSTMKPAVVYAARTLDGVRAWVRTTDEFCDGRFEPVDMTLAKGDAGHS